MSTEEGFYSNKTAINL